MTPRLGSPVCCTRCCPGRKRSPARPLKESHSGPRTSLLFSGQSVAGPCKAQRLQEGSRLLLQVDTPVPSALGKLPSSCKTGSTSCGSSSIISSSNSCADMVSGAAAGVPQCQLFSQGPTGAPAGCLVEPPSALQSRMPEGVGQALQSAGGAAQLSRADSVAAGKFPGKSGGCEGELCNQCSSSMCQSIGAMDLQSHHGACGEEEDLRRTCSSPAPVSSSGVGLPLAYHTGPSEGKDIRPERGGAAEPHKRRTSEPSSNCGGSGSLLEQAKQQRGSEGLSPRSQGGPSLLSPEEQQPAQLMSRLPEGGATEAFIDSQAQRALPLFFRSRLQRNTGEVVGPDVGAQAGCSPFARPSPVSVLSESMSGLFSPAEEQECLPRSWQSPVPFPLPASATARHPSPPGPDWTSTHEQGGPISLKKHSLQQSTGASPPAGAVSSPLRPAPSQDARHVLGGSWSPTSPQGSPVRLRPDSQGEPSSPWSSLRNLGAGAGSPALSPPRLGRLSPLADGRRSALSPGSPPPTGCLTPTRIPFSPIQAAASQLPAGSHSGSRISALLRQRLEQAKGVTRHAAPECCSTPLRMSPSPARVVPGSPARFCLVDETGRMRVRQPHGSPREDSKRPKVEVAPTEGSPEKGAVEGSGMEGVQAAATDGQNSFQVGQQSMEASPERRHLDSPPHRDSAGPQDDGNDDNDDHAFAFPASMCMGRSPSMGGMAGASTIGLPRHSPVASPVRKRPGPRRMPSFAMLPPPVFPGNAQKPPLGPGPTGLTKPPRPSISLSSSSENLEGMVTEDTPRGGEGVRRLVAIQEWEEDAAGAVAGRGQGGRGPSGRSVGVGAPRPMALHNGGGAAAPPTGPVWKRGPEVFRGGSGLNLFHGMEDAEEEEPGTPCTPAGQLHAGWPGDCPEAPDWRRKEMARCSSLKDTKLLLTTQLKRSHSVFLFDRHFDFLREVGRGSFSKVYEARDRRHGTLCAVKVSRKEFRSKGERERFLHEIESVAGLEEHPNIVNYYRSWQQDSHFYIQMELCEAGSLRQLLDGLLELMPEAEVWRSCKEIAAGLEFIHKAGVLHLDIKPENILIDKQGVLKIGDFGQAVMDQRWDWEDGDGGYLAPELLGAPVKPHSEDSLPTAPTPTPACDMFSFGALLYEISTSEALPRSRLRVASTECNAGLAKAGRSPALRALIRKLLDVNPVVRPTASDVLAWDSDMTLGQSPTP